MKEYTYYSGLIYEHEINENLDIKWVAEIGGWYSEHDTEQEAKQYIKNYLGRK